MVERETPGSVLLALTAMFSAMHAALASQPGPFGFRSWMFVFAPVEGMVLGPGPGALAAMIGGSIGCVLRGEAIILPIVAFAEPLGAASAGLAMKKRWRELIAIYGLMLAAYFAHPYGRALPAWCLWDIYIAFALLLMASISWNEAFRKASSSVLTRLKRAMRLPDPLIEIRPPKEAGLTCLVGLAAFIGLEADVLARIFMLIPMCLYALWGIDFATLVLWWQLGALATPLEGLTSTLFSAYLMPPVLAALRRRGIACPLT